MPGRRRLAPLWLAPLFDVLATGSGRPGQAIMRTSGCIRSKRGGRGGGGGCQWAFEDECMRFLPVPGEPTS